MIIQLNVEAALLYKLFLGIAYICSVGYPPLPYLKKWQYPRLSYSNPPLSSWIYNTKYSRHKASNVSLDNKEKWYGVILVKVGRFYPSKKTCQLCGHFKRDCLFQIATILAIITVSWSYRTWMLRWIYLMKI